MLGIDEGASYWTEINNHSTIAGVIALPSRANSNEIYYVTVGSQDMGEFSQTFVVKGYAPTIFLMSRKYWLDLGSTLIEESVPHRSSEINFLALARGKPSRNLYGFSLEKAHRQLLIKIVPDPIGAVCTVEAHLNFPWIILTRKDLKAIESSTQAFQTWIMTSLEKAPFSFGEEEEEILSLRKRETAQHTRGGRSLFKSKDAKR